MLLILLTGIVVATSKARINHAKSNVSQSKLNYLVDLYEMYYLKHGDWPNNLADLEMKELFDETEQLIILRKESYVRFNLGSLHATVYAMVN